MKKLVFTLLFLWAVSGTAQKNPIKHKQGAEIHNNLEYVNAPEKTGTPTELMTIENDTLKKVDITFIDDAATDGYVETISVTGTDTKTITLTRNGLASISTTFTDNNSGGGSGVSDHGALTGLGDDDHAQYFNQSRGDARYIRSEIDGSITNEIQTITKSGSTITLSNGGGNIIDSNTQLSSEQVQDFIGPMLSGNTETGISVTYDDNNNEIDFIANDASSTNELQTITKSGSTVTLSNGGGSFADANTQLSQEQVQDYIGSMVSGNTENYIGVTYDDANNELDFNVSRLNQEEVQDYIGTMFSGNTETGITVTYDDAANEIDFSVSGSTSQTEGFTTEPVTMLNMAGNAAVLQASTTSVNWTRTGDLMHFNTSVPINFPGMTSGNISIFEIVLQDLPLPNTANTAVQVAFSTYDDETMVTHQGHISSDKVFIGVHAQHIGNSSATSKIVNVIITGTYKL